MAEINAAAQVEAAQEEEGLGCEKAFFLPRPSLGVVAVRMGATVARPPDEGGERIRAAAPPTTDGNKEQQKKNGVFSTPHTPKRNVPPGGQLFIGLKYGEKASGLIGLTVWGRGFKLPLLHE